MIEQRTAKTYPWPISLLMIAGFVLGCKSETDTYVGKVLVNGVGDEATVKLNLVNMSKSAGPPRGPSQLATFTAVTEM